MSVKSLGSKLLDLIPEVLHEDLFKEIKKFLIEKGEVKEVEKPEALSPEHQDKTDDKIANR